MRHPQVVTGIRPRRRLNTRRTTAAWAAATLVAALTITAAPTGPATAAAENAAGSWSWANPLPQGNYLRTVALLDPQTAVAAGQGGMILRTADGGAGWSSLAPSPDWPWRTGTASPDAVNAVAFTDSGVGVAVGGVNTGAILRSADGGASWVRHSAPDTVASLWGVDVVNDDVAYAVGEEAGSTLGVVLRTDDGGATWMDQTGNLQQGTAALDAVSCTGVDTCTAVGERESQGGHTVVRTENGGQSWFPVQVPNLSGPLGGVFFTGADTGVVVGRGIWRTTDGGDTWDEVPSGTSSYLTAVTFADDDHGWAVGLDGTIVYTSDGGKSWESQNSSTGTTLVDVSFAGPTVGMAVGDEGMILATSDGGVHWEPLTTGPAETFNGVSFPTAQVGTVVGAGGAVMRSSDGGASWVPQDSGTDSTLYDVVFTDPDTGVAVGAAGTIVRTTDGGDSWQQRDSGVEQHLLAVSFPTASVGWAVGFGGVVLRTSDGGLTWQRRDVDTAWAMLGVFFTGANTGFVVGAGAEVWFTDDGGQTWQDRSPDSTAKVFRSAYFADADTGWVVASRGGEGLLYTEDGGHSWVDQTPAADDLPIWLRDVSFADADTGVAVGDRGVVVRTEDGGASWHLDPRITNQQLFAVAATGPEQAVAVGISGNILVRSGDGGGQPPGSPSQDVVAVVPEQGGGSLVITVDPGDRVVNLPPAQLAGSGDRLATSGRLRPVTVTDTRSGSDPGWDASAQVGEFTSEAATFGGGYVGWSPAVVSQSDGQEVAAGGVVAPGFPTGDGLSVPQTLATATAGAGVGTAVLDAELALQIPVQTPPGTYTAVLTLTAI